MFKNILIFLSLIATSPMYCMAKLAHPFTRIAQQKKPALLLGSALSLSALLAKSTETKPEVKVAVVPNSVYAEIRGTRDGWARIYKGKKYPHHYNGFENWFSRFWSPKLYFFNEKDEELLREEFKESNLHGREWIDFNEKATKNIQARLAEFPIAQKAILDTRDLKSRTYVHLHDDKGNTIATTQVNGRLRDAKPTEKLDLLTITNLKKQIKNHDFLENLTFANITKK